MRASLGKRAKALAFMPTIPIIAIGSAVAFAAPASAAVPHYLEVCKSGNNGFTGVPVQFSVDGGAAITVRGGQCSTPINVQTVGNHTVRELPTNPPSNITNIKVSGGGKKISVSGSTVTVKVKAAANKIANEAVVTYVNKYPTAQLKVCKQADPSSPTLVGVGFSFSITNQSLKTVNAGAYGSPNCTGLFTYPTGTNVSVTEQAKSGTHVSDITVSSPGATTNDAAGSASLSLPAGVTTITYTNAVNALPSNGYLEVCKYADGPFVSGLFNFNVTDAAGANYSRSVRVGQCSEPFQVAAGNATVSEVAQAGFRVTSVTTDPADALVSRNLTNGTAVVDVPVSSSPNDEVQVSFFNQASTAFLKVCKTLTTTSGALANTPFTFNISGAVNSQLVVVAGAAGTTQCVQSPNALPVGSQVTVTEVAQPNVSVVGNNPQSLTVGGGINTVTFTNQALGYIEICKSISDSRTLTGTAPTFGFTITPSSGSPITRTVQAGLNGAVRCTGPIQVPTGSATVSEAPVANYHLVGTTVNGVPVTPANPVTVNVVYGDPTNEQLIAFTNAINTATIKVCKAITDASLARGYQFATGSGSLVLPPSFLAFTLNPAVGNSDCAAVLSVPVLGTNLQPASFTAAELGQPANVLPAFQLKDISAVGGTLSGVQGINGGPNAGGQATVTLSGAPLTVLTFTNGLYVSPPPAG